jgi:hypothetical protein
VKITSTVLIAAALVLGVAVGVGATRLGSEAKQSASGQTPAPARSAPVSPLAAEKAAKAADCRQHALSDRDSNNLKAALADDGCSGVLSDETIREIQAKGDSP